MSALDHAQAVRILHIVSTISLHLGKGFVANEQDAAKSFDYSCKLIFLITKTKHAEFIFPLAIITVEKLMHLLRCKYNNSGSIASADCFSRSLVAMTQPKLRKAAKKHVHFVLLSYVRIQNSKTGIDNSCAGPLLDGICGFIDVCGEKEKAFMANCLNSHEKAVFQSLHQQYESDYKFKQK